MTRIPPTQAQTKEQGNPRPLPPFSYPREKMKRHGKMKMSSAYMPYLHWPCCRGPFNGLERHNMASGNPQGACKVMFLDPKPIIHAVAPLTHETVSHK